MFESLAHLHDTLSLPVPARSRAVLADQIFDLQQQVNSTRQQAAMADALGLKNRRLYRKPVGGGKRMINPLEA